MVRTGQYHGQETIEIRWPGLFGYSATWRTSLTATSNWNKATEHIHCCYDATCRRILSISDQNAKVKTTITIIQSHTWHRGNISKLPKSDHEKRSSCTYPERGRVARHVNEAEKATLSAANSPQLRPELLCPHTRQRLMFVFDCVVQVRDSWTRSQLQRTYCTQGW